MRSGLRSLLLFSFILLPVPALAQEDDDAIMEPDELGGASGAELQRRLFEQGNPPPQQQEQERRPEQQQQQRPAGETDDKDLDELLDGVKADSQVVADETQVRPSSPQAGAEIQRQIDAEIGPAAEALAQEQEEWPRLSEDEQRRRLEEAKRSLRAYAERVRAENAGMADALTRIANETDGAPVDSYGYGVPVRPIRSYDAEGREELGGEGEGQARWWEKLLMKVIEVGAGALRAQAATVRMNELKARADRLALQGGLQNRAFVDSRIRQAVDNSGLARMGYDKRLDDVLLGGHRTGGPLRAEPQPTPVTNLGGARTARVVPRLPRVNDPITNKPIPTVNLPLGVDAVMPIRGR